MNEQVRIQIRIQVQVQIPTYHHVSSLIITYHAIRGALASTTRSTGEQYEELWRAMRGALANRSTGEQYQDRWRAKLGPLASNTGTIVEQYGDPMASNTGINWRAIGGSAGEQYGTHSSIDITRHRKEYLKSKAYNYLHSHPFRLKFD